MDEYLLADSFLSIEPIAEENTKDLELHTFQKIPLASFLGIGGGIADLVVKMQNSKGLYRVFDPVTMEQLFDLPYQSKQVVDAAVAVVKHGKKLQNAVLVPVSKFAAIEPATLAIAIGISLIANKINEIEAKQDKLLNFLETDKRTKLEGTLDHLISIYKKYKYSLDNERFKQVSLNQMQDIERESEGNLKFYREQIDEILKRKHRFLSQKNVSTDIAELIKNLKCYRLSLYLYSFASYMEIILTGNYNHKLLSEASSKIKDYAYNYMDLYTKCYNALSDAAKSSIESEVLKKVSSASTAAGEFINKIPIIERGPVDEILISAGDKIKQHKTDSVDDLLSDLVSVHNSQVAQFSDAIDMVDEFHNSKIEVVLDQENLYVKATAAI